jgi:tetratricopeptide (TPR) repeat protein
MILGRASISNFGAAMAIFCLTLLAYLPALSGDFIWNDSDYVTAPALRSLDGLGHIWSQPGATQQYYPLLHSAFWIQHRLWGDQPFGYHLVTVLLHAGSAVLFALVLQRLAAPGAWLAALLFALHPVHVESVAWITEQKNTVSLVFYLAAILVYLRFDASRRPQTYAAALALFVLSLLCKTVTATLPAALLVAFWWKRGRLGWRREILPLLPWLALGAAAGLFSAWVEKRYIGAQGADFALPLLGRLLVAGRAIWFYAGKLVWPFHLNFIYPRWTVDTADWHQWFFPLGVAGIGAALWSIRRLARAPLAAFLIFAGSLFPVLGFVNLFGACYSWVWDHWQYLPDLGPLALAAAGLAHGWDRVAGRLRWLGPALVTALALLLGVLTWSHCAKFHDDQTLYRATIALNPDCWLARNNLGMILANTPGRLPEAISEFQSALRINPDEPKTHNNLGSALRRIPGRLPEAIAEYEAALRINPELAEAHNNLGNALAGIPGRLPEAIAEYEAALRIKPVYPEAHYNLGIVLADIPGRLPEAVVQLEAALRITPGDPEMHHSLARALGRIPGRLPKAISEYEAALRIRPDYPEAHYNLGTVLAKIPGRRGEAIAQFEAVLQNRPDWESARRMLNQLRAAQPEMIIPPAPTAP